MTEGEIRAHIEAAMKRKASDEWRLTARMTRTCWPGGSEDHVDPPALAWLRYWRPERCATPLPACSCAAGRCAVCN